MTHTVSFVVLDNLENYIGPRHITIPDLSITSVVYAVKQLTRSEEIRNPLYFFDDEYYDSSGYWPNKIASTLIEDGYYVINRWQKYYVIAFALDYTRFEVYSKDCDKKLIDWETPEQTNAVIKGIITDEDYNVNPVIKLIQSLNNT